jgi:GNAT superfamily N-acetyltransferase
MSNMPIAIRQAQIEDAAPLAALLRELGWFAALEAETADATERRVAHYLAACLADASHSLYVAEQAPSGVAGYVAVHWLPYLFLAGPEGFISELFVGEAARGQGLGTQLLDAVVREARARGCARLQLINMRQRESYQRGFYTKRGWQEREGAADFVYVLPQT